MRPKFVRLLAGLALANVLVFERNTAVTALVNEAGFLGSITNNESNKKEQ